MSALPPSTDDTLIWETWLAPLRMAAVTVADASGALELLGDRACTTSECAAAIGADERALSILLGAVAALGFVERRGGRWRATAASRTWLHPKAEGYYGRFLAGLKDTNPLHDQLLATVRTGRRPDHPAEKQNARQWETKEMGEKAAMQIARTMHAHSLSAALSAARHPLFAGIRHLMDVAGGSGVHAITLARTWPELRVTVMDLPAMAATAASYVADAGLGHRIETIGGDMFDLPWPQGPDAHFFSEIFHDWNEETCLAIARNSFASLPPGGRIILHEMLVDDDLCGPWVPAAFSLVMLLRTLGKQYSYVELRDILAEAGFAGIESVRSGDNHFSLVTGTKP